MTKSDNLNQKVYGLSENVWTNLEATKIFSHLDCEACQVARSWLITMASNHALFNNNAVSGWMRNKYKWGPVTWPLYWCEIPNKKELDCGAFSALTREYLLWLQIESFSVQLIQKYHEWITNNWRKVWNNNGSDSSWIYGDHVYHEVVGIKNLSNMVSLWDPSNSIWLTGDNGTFPDNLVEFRVLSGNHKVLAIDDLFTIPTNQWIKLTEVS